jgi:hypothetical protein
LTGSIADPNVSVSQGSMDNRKQVQLLRHFSAKIVLEEAECRNRRESRLSVTVSHSPERNRGLGLLHEDKICFRAPLCPIPSAFRGVLL